MSALEIRLMVLLGLVSGAWFSVISSRFASARLPTDEYDD